MNANLESLHASPASGAGTAQTSAQALSAVGLVKRKSWADEVLEVVLAQQRRGGKDMSRGEIRERMESKHGRRFDSGWVSARVSDLLDSGRLERVVIRRPCRSVSAGRSSDIQPVRAPATQARLVA
jgi:hypothetical protein